MLPSRCHQARVSARACSRGTAVCWPPRCNADQGPPRFELTARPDHENVLRHTLVRWFDVAVPRRRCPCPVQAALRGEPQRPLPTGSTPLGIGAHNDRRLGVLGGAPMDARIAQVVEFIQTNLDRRSHVSELAALVGLSESRLCHLFRKETGLSPAKYLKAQRIHTATRLLETTSLSVKQITYAVGFEDESHFIRAFKRISGLTPGEFRRKRPQVASECGKQRRR